MLPAKSFLSSLFILGIVIIMNSPAQAITRGEKVPDGEASETVYLDLDLNNPNRLTCTGVVIAPRVILTAGHCARIIPNGVTRIGISNRRVNRQYQYPTGTYAVSLQQQFIHPAYKDVVNGKKNSEDIQYDIAILVTAEDVSQVLRDLQFPLLPTSRTQALGIIQQGKPEAIGYGSFASERQILKRKISVQSEGITTTNYWVTRSLESGRGQCQGDSGGGLFVQTPQGRFLLGILSGIDSVEGGPLSAEDCGKDRERAAYVDITNHLCWIQNETGLELTQQACH